MPIYPPFLPPPAPDAPTSLPPWLREQMAAVEANGGPPVAWTEGNAGSPLDRPTAMTETAVPAVDPFRYGTADAGPGAWRAPSVPAGIPTMNAPTPPPAGGPDLTVMAPFLQGAGPGAASALPRVPSLPARPGQAFPPTAAQPAAPATKGKAPPVDAATARQLAVGEEEKQAGAAGLAATKEKQEEALTAAQANDAEFHRRTDEAVAQWAKARDEARASRAQVQQDAERLAQQKIDPNRFVRQMSTFGKIASFITLAAGGFVAPKMGGKNPALDFINQQIAHDVEGQRAEIENQRGALNVKSNLIAQQLAEGKDVYEATNSVIASYYQRAKDMIAARMGTMSDGEQKAALQKLWAEVDAKQNAALDAHEQQAFDNRMKQSQVGLGYAQLSQQAKFHEDEMKLQREQMGAKDKAEQAKATAEQEKEFRERSVPGVAVEGGKPLILATKEDRNKAVEEKGKTDSLVGNIDEVMELRRQFTENTNRYANKLNPGRTDLEKRLKTAGTKLLATTKEMITNGVLTEADKEVIEQMIGNPTGIADPLPQLEQLRSSAIAGTSRKLSSLYGQNVTYTPPTFRPAGAQTGGLVPAKPGVSYGAGRLPATVEEKRAAQKGKAEFLNEPELKKTPTPPALVPAWQPPWMSNG